MYLFNEGLDSRKMFVLKHALSVKWLWCYAVERGVLWRRVVEKKYKGSWELELVKFSLEPKLY